MNEIKDVKEFFEDFAKTEAETEILKWKLELKDYNANIDKANSFYLAPHISFMPREEKRKVWEIKRKGLDFFNTPKIRPPRKLFKISEHVHKEFGRFWVCYASSANNSNRASNFLSQMLFVIEKDNELKIASESLWSNYEKDGWGDEAYKWHQVFGKKHLHYDFLNEPIKVIRYEEPEDYKIGLQVYHANI
ncbi:hypothetical protein [Flavivirga algicola]|uniref:Uncharacterized protein n=1 Tax=Flavivirga algicola TaxID=2729136 RepID=A0ABX1RW63_9FLAO|nr:hypothetical protein [Flavivirga algicola]NMH86913.1 hypothetical protein [Flavivirga algicola]